ncbi:MAG: dipeptide ABC transporter ATP-binding protein [Chloroflexi bacterium]|nr:dipeptide ABC transporter ATP-binding protein [Chloroflexota bacterium]
MTSQEETVLLATGLTKHFPVSRGIVLKRQIGAVKAVDGIDFAISAGSTFGLVGESGCGKTTTGKMVVMLEKPTQGELVLEGRSMLGSSSGVRRQLRGRAQMVFQDPYSSLNPRMRVGDIIAEPLRARGDMSRRETRERVRELAAVVGLPPETPDLYPHEFSGGQRQRIAVARALSSSPRLVVLDEPVSALDVSIRAQVMNLLQDVQERFHLSYLLISHDLAGVYHMSAQVGVMYLGKFMEVAGSQELYENPLHPYTKALLAAALPADPGVRREKMVVAGEVPSPLNPPPGCRFHPRCPFAFERCRLEEPVLREAAPQHLVACHLYFDGPAPRQDRPQESADGR